MAASLKLLFAVLLLCILPIVNGQRCDVSSVEVNTFNTWVKVGFDFVFEVTVTNRCQCTVSNILMNSRGFISSTDVDPRIFRSEGNNYLINDGNGIPGLGSFKFSYTWDHWWPISPVSIQVTC